MRDKIVDEVLSRYPLTSDEQYEVADAVLGLLRQGPLTMTVPGTHEELPPGTYALVLLPEEDE